MWCLSACVAEYRNVHSGCIAPSASLPAPFRPPSTLCGSSTIRIGWVARMRSIGFSSPVFSLSLERLIDILFVDGSNRDHHNLYVRACGEVPNLAELRGVIREVLEWRVPVKAAEVILGNLEGLIDAFLDGDRGNDDDELRKAVAPVQLEDRAQIDVGFARARLHLYREVAGR